MSADRYWLETRIEYIYLGLGMTVFFAAVFLWLAFAAWRDSQGGAHIATHITFAGVSLGVAFLFLRHLGRLRRRLNSLSD